VITSGMPSFTFPTSDSSTSPSKMRSFMSATAAMVVPSLKVFEGITDSPAFTGRSRIIPSTVDTTSVDATPERFEAPSRTSSRFDTAAVLLVGEVLGHRRRPELRVAHGTALLELVRAIEVRLRVPELDLRRADV